MLVDKLTVSQLVKKYPAICGSRRFIIEELWPITMEIIRQKSAEANRNSDKKEQIGIGLDTHYVKKQEQ
jgi:hypothetical protein